MLHQLPSMACAAHTRPKLNPIRPAFNMRSIQATIPLHTIHLCRPQSIPTMVHRGRLPFHHSRIQRRIHPQRRNSTAPPVQPSTVRQLTPRRHGRHLPSLTLVHLRNFIKQKHNLHQYQCRNIIWTQISLCRVRQSTQTASSKDPRTQVPCGNVLVQKEKTRLEIVFRCTRYQAVISVRMSDFFVWLIRLFMRRLDDSTQEVDESHGVCLRTL